MHDVMVNASCCRPPLPPALWETAVMKQGPPGVLPLSASSAPWVQSCTVTRALCGNRLRPCSFSRAGVYVHVCFRQFRTCGVENVLRINTDFVLVFVFVFNGFARAKRPNPRHFPPPEWRRRTNAKEEHVRSVRSFSTTEFEQFKVNCTKSARSVLEHEHKKKTNARSCVHAVRMVLFSKKRAIFEG